MIHTETKANQITKDNCETQLAETRSQSDWPDMPYQMQIEFQSNNKQQNRNANLGQQINFVMGLDPAESRRPYQYPDKDKGNNKRLPQAYSNCANYSRDEQQGSEFIIDVTHQCGSL
jgi:hypothetical protein